MYLFQKKKQQLNMKLKKKHGFLYEEENKMLIKRKKMNQNEK